MQTKILKVGFEIEGEFTEQLRQELMDFGGFHGDPTVHTCIQMNNDGKSIPQNSGDYDHGNLYTNEFVSHPINVSPKSNLNQANAIFALLANNLRYHWNSSAGFHVHLSFNPKEPMEIWSKEFVDYFYKQLKKLFPEVLKKRKGSSYCVITTDEDKIGDMERANHYDFVNIVDAMNEHGTIEFRIFPADSPEMMEKYMLFTINTVQNFLNLTKKKPILKRKFVISLEPKEKVLELKI